MSFKHTAAAIEAEGLTHTEKLVLIILAEYADSDTGQCYPSRDTVARKAMVAPDTVTRICASLRDKGLISLQPRYRENGSRTSNSVIVFPPKSVVDAPTPPDAGSGTPPTQDRGAPDAGSGGPRLHVLDQNLSLNLSDEPNTHSAQARVADDELEAQVREAVAEVADWTSPGMIVVYPLNLLLEDRPDNPACTVREIVEAARKLAQWFKNRGLTMRNWDRVAEEARKLRNLRLSGNPVPPPPPGKGDHPASWDPERWRKAIEIALRMGKWPEKWGAPPGADGTTVPQELWKLWKQDA